MYTPWAAEEFYRVLVNTGVRSELVVYPWEGHGTAEPDHQVVDVWPRICQ